MNEKQPIFFIVKNRALGDSVMGLSSITYLRELFPNSKIIYAVPEWTTALYKNIKTDANVIYPLKLKSLSDIFDLYTDLMNLKVDAIHEMHQSGRGQKVFSLFSFLKKIPYTFHNHHLLSGTKVVDQGQKKELIQRDLDGLYSFYGKENLPNFLNYLPKFKFENLPAKKKTIILGVVATRQTKMWPLINYAELSKLIFKEFPNIEVIIPLSQSAEDQKIKTELQSYNLPSNVMIEQYPLEMLPNIFCESLLYIGNDTGLKHIAIASGIKTYTFFGPEPVREWHPYDKNLHPFFFNDQLTCRTRTHHYCGLTVCDLKENNMQCLTVFKPELVFQEIKKELYI